MSLKATDTLLAAILRITRATAILWQSAPGETAALALVLAVQGVIPAVGIYISKLTIDGLLGGDLARAIQLITAWVTAQLVGIFLTPLSQILQGNIAEKFTAHVNLRLMSKAEELLGLDLQDQKKFYDDIKILQEGAKSRPLNLVVNLVFTLRDLLTLAALCVLLASYELWLPVALLMSAVPLARATLRLREIGWQALVSRSQDARAMEYYSRLALGYDSAQEIRLFGLFAWLRERYSRQFIASHTVMRQVRVQQMGRTVPPMLISLGAGGAVFGWVVLTAHAGTLTVGVVVLVIQSITQIQGAVQGLIESSGYLFERSLFFDHYFRFLAARSQVTDPVDPQPIPRPAEIAFEGVGFAYPDGRVALKNISFQVAPGERVAVVGENGAGKTTLVKLLLRFYDPTEGRITVGGADLKTFAVAEWRAQIGAVFQNFGRYALTVAENIGIGNVKRMDDLDAISRVAGQTGFDSVAAGLPKNYESQLGKEFGGTDLSGGQWQKLAITRALFREAELLILDEPTAALDPRAEHELFNDFARLAGGRTTVLITHRLASVRMADRILVLKAGELVESGTHTELLARRGEYFDLWTLQASQYTEELSESHDANPITAGGKHAG